MSSMSSSEALQQAIDKGVTLREMARLYVEHMLEKHGNNKVHTAKALDVDRRSLQRWKVGGIGTKNVIRRHRTKKADAR